MSGIRWGLSFLDWRSHAIDERRIHPIGVYKAECDHLLMMVVVLEDRPNGKPCPACARKQRLRHALVFLGVRFARPSWLASDRMALLISHGTPGCRGSPSFSASKATPDLLSTGA